MTNESFNALRINDEIEWTVLGVGLVRGYVTYKWITSGGQPVITAATDCDTYFFYISGCDRLNRVAPSSIEVVTDLSLFPHKCSRCGASAFVGFNMVDCSAKCQSK